MTTTEATSWLAECALSAWGVVRIPAEAIAPLRKNPGTYRGPAQPAAALKLVDDQTVVAVAAVLQAISSRGWEERSFHDWGVIAAPQFLGRIRSAAAQYRFAQLSVRGVSPLLAPHQSTHAVAASISIALAIRGPCFGVGGSPGQIRDSLLTGMGLTIEGDIPGLWVVMTQCIPEPAPDVKGNCATPIECMAIAMALAPASETAALHRLRLRPAAVADSAARSPELVELAAHLSGQNSLASSWFCKLGSGLSMEISRVADAQIATRAV